MAQLLSIEERLNKAGIVLPEPASPIGCFANTVIHDGVVWVSGQGPINAEGELEKGKVGQDISRETARAHARLVGINILGVLNATLGGLDKVDRVLKLTGLINATPDFQHHPYVIDGISNLMVEIFEEKGIHGRTSFGVASLPNNITVEIEGMFTLK
ncbi:RidA family protein [Natronospirillum operosum]|uniref:RidA family protein n=1 Tax=Natronospirillum operosum TaxID=2759953 RepID=A0A4Z0W8E4_9GAMM|nr:RidA family protein [Natronospirillum operosum]TGG94869.1 RidA family protein [Natronospirillum operosum]